MKLCKNHFGHEIYFNEDGELTMTPDQKLRKSLGIYYTPTYIINYIVENTLGIKLEEIWNDVEKLLDKGKYREAYNRFKDVSKIKVVDPACGSGSFLVRAFNLIKEYYERYNKKIEEIQQIKNKEFTMMEGNQLNLEEERFLIKFLRFEKQILNNNIYGVDLDPSACEIASVNLMLQALKRGEELPLILDENIKVGNSLVSGSTEDLEAYFQDVEKEKPFNWEEEFKDVFLDGGFDVVIGNPPYISFGLGRTGKLSINEERYYREVYSNSAEYKISTYALFMERGIDLLSNNSRFGFIIPDSFLTGSYFSKIRRKILDTCKIKVITLFTKDFWKAGDVGFPVILILEKEKDSDLRDANYLTTQACKTPVLFVAGEVKSTTYQQSYFQATPRNRFRLWFNERDMNIIKKMERNSLPLNAVMSLHQGIRSKVGREKIVSKIKQGDSWKKGLISSAEISRYWLGYEGNYINVDSTLLFKGGWEKESIEQEKLLIRRTGDSLIATLDEVGYYHTNALIYAIKKDTTDIDVDYEKKFVLALFNSTLLNFYYKKITMKEGRSLPQIEIDTLEDFPIPKVSQEELKPFIDLVTKIISLNAQKRSLFFLFGDLSNKFDQNRLLRPFSKYYAIERTPTLEDYTEEEVERRYSTSNYTMNIVKSMELIKHEEEGRVEKVKCDIEEEYLVLNVKIKGEADFRTMLKVYFEDALIKEFFELSIKSYLEENSRKRYWNKEKIWEVLDAIKIPKSVPNVDADIRNIKKLMKTFEEAYMKKLSEEFKESPVKELNLTKIEEEIEKTDNLIDQKVYELYELTEEEIEIVEKERRI